MGLSEFISKNNEHPDPQIEFEKSKLLVKTLLDSGAISLLGKLRDSIISNPTLNNYFVRLEKLMFVNDRPNVLECLKKENGQLLKGFVVEFSLRDDLDNVPCARVELDYNHSREEDMRLLQGGGFRLGPPDYVSYGSYIARESLGVDCSEPGKLKLYRRRKFMARKELTYLEESQWRKANVLDDALGALYSQSPAEKR